jgi:hypothetical protein
MALAGLLHRSLARTGAIPDLLLLEVLPDFGRYEWAIILATFAACVHSTVMVRGVEF